MDGRKKKKIQRKVVEVVEVVVDRGRLADTVVDAPVDHPSRLIWRQYRPHE